ncbi:MAG: formylglycine-generating enzyme family protein [Acidobacteria bacterium]|nr:formylglycine-generating enzyme family protein [Acidobacteriota bacterium]
MRPLARIPWTVAAASLLLVAVSAPAGPGASPAPSPGAGTGSVTVLVPAGEFRMGADPNDMVAFPEERPVRKVSVKAFRIDRFETTNAEYRKFVVAARTLHPNSCSPLEPPGSDHTPPALWWDDLEWNADVKPVNGVNWFDAYAYCAWVGKRLPTEAEWERAARGSDGRRYPWGNEPPGPVLVGNFADETVKRLNPKWKIVPNYVDGFAHTAPVGSFPKGASPYGVEDMAGNVWEWVADWWEPNAYGDPNAPPTGVAKDPKGPESGTARVLRGGSWDATGNFLRVSARHSQTPTYKGISLGIRCAQDVP